MYEYSRLDEKIDFSTFYHDDMWQRNILDDTSKQLIEQYKTVPLAASHLSMGLEFDCGSKQPALFARLHPQNIELNRTIFNRLADIVDVSNSTMPTVPSAIKIEDVGVFPERATGLFRILTRGSKQHLKQFADSDNCVNTDIIEQSTDVLEGCGLSFDWDGALMSNFMFHSATIHCDDPWVIKTTQHAHDQIARLSTNRRYSISRYVKVSLSPTAHPYYMKAYFTVRITQ